MAKKRPVGRSGRVFILEHDSKVLRDNPLRDPHVRKVGMWLPAEYDDGAGRGRGRRFPALYDLVGYTGSGLAHLNWRPFSEYVAERAARLVNEGKMPPVV